MRKTRHTFSPSACRPLALLWVLLAGAQADAAPLELNRGMSLILGEYLQLHLALSRAGSGTMAKPTARAVGKAARRVHRLAQRILATHSKEKKALSPRRRWLLESIAKAGATMSWAKHLRPQRQAMAQLSRAMATWAIQAQPKHVNVVYFEGRQQVWLQRGKQLRSPYFGFGAGVLALSGLVVSGPHKGHGTGLSHPCPDEANHYKDRHTGHAPPPTLPDYLRPE